jgi:hypothetical protein
MPQNPPQEPPKPKCPYYDAKGGLCLCMYPCVYQGEELHCAMHGMTLPRRPGQTAVPAPRPSPQAARTAAPAAASRANVVGGAVAAVSPATLNPLNPGAAAAPEKRSMPASVVKVLQPASTEAKNPTRLIAISATNLMAVKIEPTGTVRECADGGGGFFFRGICLGGEHDACQYQTDVRLPVKSSHPDLQNQQFARCIKYDIAKCPAGDRSLYHHERHVCLATGRAHCSHQVATLKVALENGKEYDYCARYE